MKTPAKSERKTKREPRCRSASGRSFEGIRSLFEKYVVPSYARFDVAFVRGAGSYLWDVDGRRYLDLGSGIAVCALGHANAELAEVLQKHSARHLHVSNLYYHEWQGRLAEK
ncbi:MAG: aminotransferase class III-fold pyridoxal phosphate-dependent enzyme, partial [Verrucomicrobiae bacterium]|nr:aminotransferase class III-fold pyridoxal phosphate-dependent enzyme [Verrucomicrobiae bacterium]